MWPRDSLLEGDVDMTASFHLTLAAASNIFNGTAFVEGDCIHLKNEKSARTQINDVKSITLDVVMRPPVNSRLIKYKSLLSCECGSRRSCQCHAQIIVFHRLFHVFKLAAGLCG